MNKLLTLLRLMDFDSMSSCLGLFYAIITFLTEYIDYIAFLGEHIIYVAFLRIILVL